MTHDFLNQLRRLEKPFNLALLLPPPALRLWIPAPHPDDFEAMVIALCFFRRHKAELYLDIVSPSSSGVEDDYGWDIRPESKALCREREQRDSSGFFGLPVERLRFLRLPEDAEGHPIEDAAAIACLQERLSITDPDLVFLPHGADSNAGHRRVARMLQAIVRKHSRPLSIWQLRDPKTVACRIDAFFPFSEEEAAWKAMLLRLHGSQHRRNLGQRGIGLDRRILDLNRRVARELSIPEEYAEAFELSLPQ